MTNSNLSRRNLLKGAAVAATLRPAGVSSMSGERFEARPTVRVGLIGVGARGSEHVRILLAIDNVQLNAVCDTEPGKVAAAQKRARDAGAKEPAGYTNGERDFENLVKRDDLDIVLIATPWDWHVPMALAAMSAGKHA